MTPKEINDLKRKHNELLARGQEMYAEVMRLHNQCLELQAHIRDAEGPNYDPIPLIFGGGFHLDDDL